MDIVSENKIKCPKCKDLIGAGDMNSMGDFSPCNPNDSDKYKAQCPSCKSKFDVLLDFHCVASIKLSQ